VIVCLHPFDQKKLPCQDFLSLFCVCFWHRRVFNSNNEKRSNMKVKENVLADPIAKYAAVTRLFFLFYFLGWSLNSGLCACKAHLSHTSSPILSKTLTGARCQWLTPCNPSYSGGRNQENHSSKSTWANSSWDLILKNPTQKRVGGVAQAVECLLNKHETLSSNPSTSEK
jgi:hypothetical protein